MTPIEQRVLELLRAGENKAAIARAVGITRPKVQRIARKFSHRQEVRNEALEALGLVDRTERISGDTGEVEVRVSRFVATEAEAVAASGVNTGEWDVVGQEVRHYPIATADGPIQGSYIKLRLQRKTPLSNPDRLVDAIITGLQNQGVAERAGALFIPRRESVLRLRAITDLHIGGYAWCKSTGGDNWDIHTALETALACNAHLDEQAPERADESLIWFGGDLAHFDTPKGTTTGGTQLDLDSRVDLMLAALTEYVTETVEREASKRKVTVIVSEGNHDQILSKVIRRLLLLVFGKHKGVTVMERFTPRQYFRYGDTLLGFTHGDGNRQRIVDAMAHECGRLGLWDGAKCRELHMGHVHHESAKQRVLFGADSLSGVVVRTHVALTPQDQYHTNEAWVGSHRGMSDFFYHPKGALVGTAVAVPHLLAA